ncbi:MAG: hypothetical protein VXZ83_02630 [Verrucomicrobiota bacterium]|nr:hypothetical protein [Verrucomicrobiota bacterium]
MTDISDKNTPNELASERGEQLEPKAPLRLATESKKVSEFEPAPSISNSQISKQVQEPSEVTKAKVPTPTAAPISAPIPEALKVTSNSKLTISAPKHDSSISIDEDTDTSTNIKLFIFDALAAAIAIAFTVLILQDNLPFLK